MIETTLTLDLLTLEAPGQTGALSACPPGLRPRAGQYCLAHAPALEECLPTALFAQGYPEEGKVHWAAPLPPGWAAGTQLVVRGPLGKGFSLPPSARRVGLAALEGLPLRLLPVMHQALEQDASVALYTSAVPRSLPDEVEVLPLDLLPEAPAWADYLALDAPLARLGELPALLGLRERQRCACAAQAVVFAPMPCGGLADCAVCAVPTARGWKRACRDGPVFSLNLLLDL